ncbi:MAG: LysR family transcriptional regulator [Lachnospiraceae bacterium]|nr:LysR family transcriptional regulator [Lachnospiraceae bacterium]
MKLHQLKYFSEVCRQNGISRAAAALHISQPAVSNAIKELEAEFNLQLFKRADQKLTLTKEGAYFLLEVEELLAKVNDLTQKMYDLRKHKEVVRVGLPPMISVMAFQLIQEFHSQNPQVHLELYDEPSIKLRKMLQEDQVDVIIVSGMNTDFVNFGFSKLQSTELLFCVNQNHPLAREPYISIAHAALEPLAMFHDGFYVKERVLELFHEVGYTPKVLWNTQQFNTHIQLIRNGIASGFLFREIVENEPDIVGIPLEEPVHIDVEIIWQKNGKLYQNIKCLIQFAQQYAKASGLRCLK